MLKFIKIFLFCTVLISAMSSLATHSTFAQVQGGGNPNTQVTGGGGSGTIQKLINPLNSKFNGGVEELIFALADLAIVIGTIIAVFVFIYIGFKFVMAQGNESEISEAKSWFLNAVIGTAVLISSKVIVEIMKNTLVSAGIIDDKLFK